MRFIARVTLPVQAGNQFCRDKEMNRKMETILSEVRPETVYFGVENGQRTLFCVVNVEQSHDLPRVSEPFWLGLQANVDFIPVMNQEEFKKAASVVESSVRKINWT